MSIVRADKKLPAALLAIFLGSFGLHKFYLGFPKAGLTMLGIFVLANILGFHWVAAMLGLVAFIEGIIYLTRSDYDFNHQYVNGRREWF